MQFLFDFDVSSDSHFYTQADAQMKAHFPNQTFVRKMIASKDYGWRGCGKKWNRMMMTSNMNTQNGSSHVKLCSYRLLLEFI